MSDIVEGRNAVLEFLRSGGEATEILIAQGRDPDDRLDEIDRLAADNGVPVRQLGRTDLDKVSVRGSHQGVVARVAPFEYAALEDVMATGAESLVVVLDHVTDPQNLGAIVRSAEAIGADGVIIPKARAAGVTASTMKASAGAASHLPIALVPNVARAIARLKEADYWVAGASESGQQASWDAPLSGRIALVLGAEGSGLSRLVEESCDFLVRIPLTGRTPSLNVAQAATVLAYEWARRRDA